MERSRPGSTDLNAMGYYIYIVNCVTGQTSYLPPVRAFFMYVSVCLRAVKCFLCARDGIRVTAVADYL